MIKHLTPKSPKEIRKSKRRAFIERINWLEIIYTFLIGVICLHIALQNVDVENKSELLPNIFPFIFCLLSGVSFGIFVINLFLGENF